MTAYIAKFFNAEKLVSSYEMPFDMEGGLDCAKIYANQIARKLGYERYILYKQVIEVKEVKSYD